MSDCEDYRPYLAAAADDELDALDAALAEQVRAHIRGCHACAGEIDALGGVADAYAGEQAPPVSPARWESLWQAVEAGRTAPHVLAHPTTVSRRWRRRMLGALAGVGAAAAMILLAVWALPDGPLADLPPRTIAPVGDDGTSGTAMDLAFATDADSEIEEIETFQDDETPMVLAGSETGVSVIWVVTTSEGAG